MKEDFIFQPKGKKIKGSFFNKEKTTFFFFLSIFLLASVYFFYLQIFYKEKALKIQKQITEVIYFSFPPRGNVYDRKGKLIAGSELSFDAYLDLREVKNVEEIKNFLQGKYFYRGDQIIIRNFDKKLALQILSQKEKYPFIEIVPSYQRSYFFHEEIGNLLGYLGFPQKEEKYYQEEYVGQAGIELAYQDWLRGELGEIVYQRTKNGLKKINEINPKAGKNLVLSIDSEFQKKAYELMNDYFKRNGYKRGALILLDPNSGEVLSLISYPSYNPEVFLKDPNKTLEVLNSKDQPLFNRVVSGIYNPGSAIKPIVLAGALEEKIINPETKIFSGGQIKIPNPYFPGTFSIFKDNKFHGWTDARKAIYDSVNIYFYVIGGGYSYDARAWGYPEDIPIKVGLGIERLNKWWRNFNLGQKTGIDLIGEKVGFLPSPETKAKNIWDPVWRLGDTYNVSIGQGDILVTPLQIALWTSYFAVGKIYQPYLVKEIVDENGKVVFKREPKVLKENIISKESLKVIQEGMRMTAMVGTAKAYLSDLPVAGKSGTPEVFGKKKLNAIFTGYFPYQNPKAVMTLIIEDVSIGSVASLPLYRELVKLYFETYGGNTF